MKRVLECGSLFLANPGGNLKQTTVAMDILPSSVGSSVHPLTVTGTHIDGKSHDNIYISV